MMNPKKSKAIARVAMALTAVIMAIAVTHNASAAISTQQLTENIYMLSGRGGNIGVLVGNDGSFLIDGKDSTVFDDVKQAVDSLGGPIKYLLNTHYHGDHTGANKHMKKSGALLLAHENVRSKLMSDVTISYFGSKRPALGEEWLPLITFESGLTFHLNGEEIDAFYVGPAHTDGDVVVYFKNANVVHVGDIFFNTMYPFIDLDNGGNFDGLLKAIDVILARINQNTIVIPGHGPVSDYASLKGYRDMLATIVNRVQAMINDGKSLDEVIAAKPSVEFDGANTGFIPADDLVKFVYEDLVD